MLPKADLERSKRGRNSFVNLFKTLTKPNNAHCDAFAQQLHSISHFFRDNCHHTPALRTESSGSTRLPTRLSCSFATT